MSALAIETKGLSKQFGSNTAVDGLNLIVERGSIFGFLGPNGAGKTTTIKMLLGLLFPTSGEGRVLGHDMARESLEIRKKAGYMSETQSLYGYMTVKEIINFTKEAYPVWDDQTVRTYLDLFELPATKKVKALSKGMRTQLGLVLALGPQPELLIMDEPTSGLDPIKQKEFLATIVDQVARTGQTVFFSSHHLWEVERIADTVGIISKGKLVLSENLDELKTNQRRIKIGLEGQLPDQIRNMPGVVHVSQQGKGYVISVNRNVEEIVQSLQTLNPVALEVVSENLEDIFLEYAGGDRNEK